MPSIRTKSTSNYNNTSTQFRTRVRCLFSVSIIVHSYTSKEILIMRINFPSWIFIDQKSVWVTNSSWIIINSDIFVDATKLVPHSVSAFDDNNTLRHVLCVIRAKKIGRIQLLAVAFTMGFAMQISQNNFARIPIVNLIVIVCCCSTKWS